MGDTDRRLEKKRKGEKGMFLPLSTMGSLYSSNCSFSVTLALNRHACNGPSTLGSGVTTCFLCPSSLEVVVSSNFVAKLCVVSLSSGELTHLSLV